MVVSHVNDDRTRGFQASPRVDGTLNEAVGRCVFGITEYLKSEVRTGEIAMEHQMKIFLGCEQRVCEERKIVVSNANVGCVVDIENEGV